MIKFLCTIIEYLHEIGKLRLALYLVHQFVVLLMSAICCIGLPTNSKQMK